MGPSSRTMAFLNLTSAQMYYMLGTRFKAPLWETGLKFRQNPRIPLAFISGIGLQNLAFFTPMLRNILGMSKISLGDWIVAQSLALTPLLVHELKKNSNIQKEIDNAI